MYYYENKLLETHMIYLTTNAPCQLCSLDSSHIFLLAHAAIRRLEDIQILQQQYKYLAVIALK